MSLLGNIDIDQKILIMDDHSDDNVMNTLSAMHPCPMYVGLAYIMFSTGLYT